MKKNDIIEAIYQNTDYYKKDIEIVFDEIFNIILNGLAVESKVMIKDFGTFEKIYQNDYYGVDANTGERTLIKGGYRIRFTSSKNLKNKINS